MYRLYIATIQQKFTTSNIINEQQVVIWNQVFASFNEIKRFKFTKYMWVYE